MRSEKLIPWWGGVARRKLGASVEKQARMWHAQKNPLEIRHFDFLSRLKIGFLFASFVALLILFRNLPDHPLVTVTTILGLGLFVIPYTRIFMHSQMHWGMGGNRVTKFLLDHFVSLIYSVSQTSYSVGHRMHHRFDNDLPEQGWAKDLQSTYLFSRNGKPSSIFLWVPYYMFVFQHLVAPCLVFREGKTGEKIWYCIELAVLICFHYALCHFHPGFYSHAYLPGLVLAWFASSVVLYMMHAVDAGNYSVHPTNTSLSGFFNSFGDNDGYHLEHTLFPSVHPLYLPRLHAIIAPGGGQVFKDHYFIAGIKYAFTGSVGRGAGAARSDLTSDSKKDKLSPVKRNAT